MYIENHHHVCTLLRIGNPNAWPLIERYEEFGIVQKDPNLNHQQKGNILTMIFLTICHLMYPK